MRFLAAIVFILWLSAFGALAQTEVAIRAFEAGVIAAQSEQHDRALPHFERALEKSKFSTELPNEFLARINYNVGVCLYRLNRPAEAVGFLNAAVSQAKNKYPKASRALGMAHTRLGDWQAAEQSLAHVVRLDKRDAESWFDLAFVYLHENDLERAATAFERAIRYNSVDRAAAHNNLGVIAALIGDWQTAQTQFETALDKSNNGFALARRNLRICRSPGFATLVAKLEFTGNPNIHIIQTKQETEK